MDEQLKQMLEKYISLKAQLKDIEEQIEEIKPTIQSVVYDNGGKYEFDDYVFSLSFRKKYEYNKFLLDMIAELEKVKKDFEKNSEPSAQTPVLNFKPKKYDIPV